MEHVDQNLLDRMCRTALATMEMFEHSGRIEITTNILDEDGTYAGAFVVSATRDENGATPIVGIEHRRSDIFEWNKAASDKELFGSVE